MLSSLEPDIFDCYFFYSYHKKQKIMLYIFLAANLILTLYLYFISFSFLFIFMLCFIQNINNYYIILVNEILNESMLFCISFSCNFTLSVGILFPICFHFVCLLLVLPSSDYVKKIRDMESK